MGWRHSQTTDNIDHHIIKTKRKNDMSKDREIKFVGQPIFGQILKLIDKPTFISLVREKQSDYYYKSYKSWDQLGTMLFGI
jgi:hypothetical protein